MKRSSRIWIWIAIVVVAVSQATVTFVRARFEPRTIRAPRMDLMELGATLGDWHSDADQASKGEIDEELFKAIGADQVLSRIYTDGRGAPCSLHLALWQTETWLPHSPELCYPGQGFKAQQRSRVALPSHPEIVVASTRYVRPETGHQVVILYWYQIGSRVYVDRNGGRDARQHFWGTPSRPPLVKVLLQIDYTGSDEDQQRLADIADHLYEFVTRL